MLLRVLIPFDFELRAAMPFALELRAEMPLALELRAEIPFALELRALTPFADDARAFFLAGGGGRRLPLFVVGSSGTSAVRRRWMLRSRWLWM